MNPSAASSGGLLIMLIHRYGVLGLWIGTFLESVGIPFTSAVVVFTAGTMISSGQLTICQAIVISTLGLLAGSIVSYSLGYYGVKIGKSFRRNNSNNNHNNNNNVHAPAIREQLSKFKLWPTNNPALHRFIAKYGSLSILLAQLFGVTRAIISYPAGALGINLFKFILYTAIGGVIFSTIAVLGSFFITRLVAYLLTSVYFWLLVAGGGAGGFLYYYSRKRFFNKER